MNSHVLFLIKGMSPSFCLPAMCVSFIHSSKRVVETHIFKHGFQSPLKLTAAHPAPSRPAIGSRDATVGRVWPLRIKRIRKTFSPHSNRDRYIPSQTSFKSRLGMSTTHSFFFSQHFWCWVTVPCVFGLPKELRVGRHLPRAIAPSSVPVNISSYGMSESMSGSTLPGPDKWYPEG